MIWYRMDRGYHRHTLIFWEDEQRLDAARTEGMDDFEVSDGVDFIWEICETRASFSAPSENLPAVIKKRQKDFFCSSSTARDAIIIHHMFAHTVLTINIGVPSVLVGWECITPSDSSIPAKVFDNLASGAR